MPDDSVPAPWPEASAERSALARPPLKRWGFRCLRVLRERSKRNGSHMLRRRDFPGREEGTAVGLPTRGPKLRARASGAKLR